MSTQAQRKKATERFYLDKFQELSGLQFVIVEEGEAPDFLLKTADGKMGLEVTSLYKDEDHHGGSRHREREGRRERYMNALTTTYYEQGGKPATVSAILPGIKLEDSWILNLAKRLRMARPRTVWKQKRLQIDFGRNTIATFCVTALPEEAGNYTRWKCANNHVGSPGSATAEILSEKIEKKAGNLSRYAKAAGRTILLIVTERTRGSGMFDYTPASMLSSHGFSEVHLLIHPLKSCRIA